MGRTMSANKEIQEPVATKTIRLCIVSRIVKDVEDTCNIFTRLASENKADFRGPVRLPTKHLRISTRKTPCGEGSKTWDAYTMDIHKRILDIEVTDEILKKFADYETSPSVSLKIEVLN
eukprot:GDKJ01023666.1.p1 GENE.GDKJ01023666.1~~GDKJ01023666.1.p1  ORF type:complete len:119 (-),score=18.51 GDKJ01023666.1:76-432(-)